jgi:translation initiation factor IF-3
VHLVNEEIKVNSVRIVGAEEDYPVMSTDEALDIAYDNGYDLVQVAEKDGVAMCRMMDYSKFLYEQKKNKKQAKKAVTKEIKFGCMIADHDLGVYAKKASVILKDGDRVQVMIAFKGRMMAYMDSMAEELMQKFVDMLSVNVNVVRPARQEGYNYTATFEFAK